MINKTFNPILFYSKKLLPLLLRAQKEKNPSLYLYQNNARTPLFMLEALTRIYGKSTNEKIFKKWNKRFKKMEDALGQIDHYSAYQKEFSVDKKIPKAVIEHFAQEAKTSCEKLNKHLLDKNWHTDRLSNFDEKISLYKWNYNQVFASKIKVVLEAEIKKIISVCAKANFSFVHLEEDVHELRRRLRWISIYATALNGLIQLKKSVKKPNYNINYLSKEVLNSPYNKLAPKPKNCSIIELDANSFYALSYLIKQLGDLKDKGLSIEALSLAFIKTEKITPLQAKAKALKTLDLKNNSEKKLLKAASDLMRTSLTKDKVLRSLVT